mmetsp:Transcript_56071/g.149600  ORF Transcript_56071/g.149600 Transcript_56071/m.149600 type:complete len:215 (-) Transcript_56071:1110-1754(-)
MQIHPRAVGALHTHRQLLAPDRFEEPARKGVRPHVLDVQGRVLVQRRRTQGERVPFASGHVWKVHKDVHARGVHPLLSWPVEGDLCYLLWHIHGRCVWLGIRPAGNLVGNNIPDLHLFGRLEEAPHPVDGPYDDAREHKVPSIRTMPQSCWHEHQEDVVRVPEELPPIASKPRKDAKTHERRPEDRGHRRNCEIVCGHRAANGIAGVEDQPIQR